MELIDLLDQYWSVAHLNSIMLQGLIELIIISGILIFKLNIMDWKPKRNLTGFKWPSVDRELTVIAKKKINEDSQ